MAISREVLEREIAGAKAAIKAHKEGLEINGVVLEKFEEELKKHPPKEKTKEKKVIGV